MSQRNKPRERKIGTNHSTTPEKRPLIDPRYKNLIYTIIFIVIVLAFFIINNTRPEPDHGPYPPDYNPAKFKNTSSVTQQQTAPDFELTSIDGKKIKLSDYKNKVVILDFWATWCGPCRESTPDLVALKKQFKDKQLEIIGISLDDENSRDAVKPFVEKYGITYPVVYGNSKIVQDYGNISGIPTTFIIDQQGKIVTSHLGQVPKKTLEDEINKLLTKT